MKQALLWMFFLALCPTRLHAQTTGAAFLNNDHSPEAVALGMSDASTSLGAQSIGANPANLDFMNNRFELYSSYATLTGGASFGHIAAAMALNPSRWLPFDALGIAVTRQSIGGLQEADYLGNQTGGTFGSDNLALAGSLSGKVRPNLRLGFTGKIIKETIAGYSSNAALAADLGLTYSMNRFHGLSINASLNNLGQKIGFIGQYDGLPTSLNLGAALPIGPARAIISLNRTLALPNTNVGMGLTYALGPIEFRGGLLTQGVFGRSLALQDQSGFSQLANGIVGGLGINVGYARIDYAITEGAPELGINQRVSLTLQWGGRAAATSTAPHESGAAFFNPTSLDWHLIRTKE